MKIRRIRNNDKGTLQLEFAIIAPVLLFFAFSAIELMFATYKVMSLQYLANFGLRQLIIAPLDEEISEQEHSNSVQNNILQHASQLGISLQPENVSVCPASIPDCEITSATRWNELMIVKIAVPFNFFKLNIATIKGISVGRTEPK